MDSYERFVRVLNFEDPDRVPTLDSIRSPRIVREMGGSGPAEEAVPRAHSALGLDVAYGGVGAATASIGEDPPKIWTSKYYNLGLVVCEKPFTFRWDPATQTTWVTDRPFKNLNDLDEIGIEPLPEGRIIEEQTSEFLRSKEAYERYGVVYIGYGGSVLETSYRILGFRLFAQALLRDRHRLRKLIERITPAASAYVRSYAEARIGPAFIYGDDIAGKNGLLFNPDFLRNDWLPIVRKIVQPLARAGIKLIYHSEGNTESMLNDLIDAGFEGLWPVEPQVMDIGEIKRKYGDKIVLIGGGDNHYLLQHGSPEEVEQQARESIEKAAPGSGFCLSTDELNPDTPTVNAIAAYRAARKYGVYPTEQ